MFDLFKDIEKYKGVTPYASEMYGVYQPLLGWRSGLTRKWIQRGGNLVDPRLKALLSAWIKPGPTAIDSQRVLAESIAEPLLPGSGRSPYTVYLARDLGSELLKRIQARVQGFVEEHGGTLPDGVDQWREVIDRNDLMDAERGDLRKVNDLHRDHLMALAVSDGEFSVAAKEQVRAKLLQVMQYESQIAAFLLFHTSSPEDHDPDQLKRLFVVKRAPPLHEVFDSHDPLARIDPNDRSGALSPLGLVHLHRQLFFNLGTFLGEAVEHVWLSPGATMELIEVSTRRELAERAMEALTETTKRAEQSTSIKDELSEAIKEENKNSTKLGVSQTNSVNLYVYQGTVSATLGVESMRSSAREEALKHSREQIEKLASEIKQSFKSTFRTVSETTDTRSRRHVIENKSGELVNYELRRKMRRVGVQEQSTGTRLCWQVFVDDPGAQLGLAELVHQGDSPDLANLKEPEKIPMPGVISKKVVMPFPFKPVADYHKNNVQYEWNKVHIEHNPDGSEKFRVQMGLIKADEDDDDSEIIIEHPFKVDPPQTGYEFNGDIRMVGVQGGKLAIMRSVAPLTGGAFNVALQRVNFGGENFVNLEFEVFFRPTADEVKRVEDANAKADTKYKDEVSRLTRKTYLEAVRKRIKDASSIRPRPSWDLREEERTVVYRRLLERLMLDSWRLPDTQQNRRLSHVRSEVIRAIFDVDSMLYFVAPEWWMPRRHQSHLSLGTDLKNEGAPLSLRESDVTAWGGESRPDNYRITEESTPARLGSSLGWLLQLDGDNLRNAFLNAPWVKAVIPIRPGREKAALNWLRTIEGHADDGWDAPYLPANDGDEFDGLTIGEVLEILATRLEKENGTIESVLAADKVFEYGFDHLAEGFDASVDPDKPFTQYIAVVPTDQLVANKYEPVNLFDA